MTPLPGEAAVGPCVPEPLHIGVLALQGAYAAHQIMLERLGARTRPVRSVADLSAVDGLVLPGGESSSMLHFLRQDGFWPALTAFAASRPCLGTCAGVILLARTVEPEQPGLGALHVAVRRNGYGRQRESSIRRGPSSLPGEDLDMIFIRAPVITRCEDGVEVLARLDGDPVLVRQGHLLGCTFHPELSGDTRVHRMFLQMCRAPA